MNVELFYEILAEIWSDKFGVDVKYTITKKVKEAPEEKTTSKE